jgi:hypothetical protein
MLCACALPPTGINKNSAAEETAEVDWETTFNINTKGVFLCCQVGSCGQRFLVARLGLSKMQDPNGEPYGVTVHKKRGVLIIHSFIFTRPY